MVRALPRQPSLELDPKRITANAVVIALHAAAFALLMMPVSRPPATDRADDDPLIVVVPEVIPPKPLLPVPIAPSTARLPAKAAPILVPRQPTQLHEASAVTSDQQAAVMETGDPGTEAGSASGTSTPALAQLTLLSGPAPRYPRQALREGRQGEVLLRVLVSVDGLPVEVLVERSSGHRELDAAALRQVKASWRFQPAVVDGRTVPAYALVPILFTLPR